MSMGTYLTFYLCGNLLGVDVTLVREINRQVEYTPVPDTAAHIVGLFNMRGQVVTLFDIARLIHCEEKEWGEKVVCIILKAPPNDPNQVGFLIDGFGDVLDVSAEDQEPPPANVSGINGDFIKSIVKLEKELLLIIDPEKLFK